MKNLGIKLSLFLYNTPELTGAINPDKTADLTNIYINTHLYRYGDIDAKNEKRK